MTLFKKTLTTINNKIALACLALTIALLFSAFRGPDVKENKTTAALISSISESKLMCNAKATDIIFQSKDGGQTWEDISYNLPGNEEPEGFFAGESHIYVRVRNEMYRSKSNLKTPVWEKESDLDPRCTSIAFNRSGVFAYSYEGRIYKKMTTTDMWLPVYTNLKSQSVRTIFESSDGTVFISCENGLYKSIDKGRTWNQVVNDASVGDMVESKNVLIATSPSGIIRSTDKGEHWERVISEGGVGIAVERIDGGFAAIAFNTATNSRRIFSSLDDGKTWQTIDEGLQPSMSISSVKQMGRYLISGHPQGIFQSSDMGKTWNVVYANAANPFKIYPVQPKVFTIYAAGNVLYAVARSGGC